MAGILEAGGAIDNLFDVVRSDIGKADTTLQAWFHDRLKQETSRYDIQSVMYWYCDGISTNQFTPFGGMNDVRAKDVSTYLALKTGLTVEFCYNVIFGLTETAKTDDACARVLNGNGVSVFDTIMNAGPVQAASNLVNDGLKALGLPSIATTVIIIIVVALIALVIYKKVK